MHSMRCFIPCSRPNSSSLRYFTIRFSLIGSKPANPGDAYERAIKAAETDATKRALATFGNRFGLGLYDKEQNGVTPRKPDSHPTGLSLYVPGGEVLVGDLSAEGFCTGLR